MSGLWLLLLLFAAEPEAAPEAPSPTTVRRLLRELDAPEIARRQAAEEQLLRLGPALLDLLPAPDDGLSAEVRQRLDRVRSQLELARAKAVAAGSRVTLAAPLTLSQALAKIEEQTGNRSVDYREEFGQQVTDPSLQVEAKDALFWPTFDRLLDEAGLSLYNSADQGALTLVNRSSNDLPRAGRAAYAELFRVEATTLEARRNLRANHGDALRVSLEVAWEPRVAPIVLRISPAEVTATLANQEVLEPLNRSEVLNLPARRGSVAVTSEIDFELPPREVRLIARWRGKIDALIPGKTGTFRFTDLEPARPKVQTQAEATVTFEGMRKNNDVWQARLRVRFDRTQGALESYQSWIFDNRVFLAGSEERKLEAEGFETFLQSDQEVGIAYFFDLPDGPAGWNLVYETPTVLMQIGLDYELTDLPLP